jgi:hypothetical protein
VTIAAAPTDFALVDGWTQGTLTGPAGILPAGLFGKVPAGDPYLAHINVLSPNGLGPGDFFELQSGIARAAARAISCPHRATRGWCWCGRPIGCAFVQPQAVLVVELLIESIGGVNELGSRLADWSARAVRRQCGGSHPERSRRRP